MERFKQKLAKVENEKRELTLEYQRLCRGLGQCSDFWFHPSYDFFTGDADLNNAMLKNGIVNARNRVPSRRVKIEPHVVLDTKLLNHKKATMRDYSQEYPSPKDPGFKQELVLTALRAIGGKGTLDDVDKWVRKHHRQLYGDGLNRRVLSRALSRQAESKVLNVERRTKNRRWNIYRIPGMIPCGRAGQRKPSPVRKHKTNGDTRDIPYQNVPFAVLSNHAKKASPKWTTSLIVPTNNNNKQSPSASIVRRPAQSLMNIPVTNVGITASLSVPAMSDQDKLSLENIPRLIAEETPAQNASPLTQVA